MKLTKEEKSFLIMNKGRLLPILNKYLDEIKTHIWKEKDINKKASLSSVGDEIESWIIGINNMNLDKKEEKEFTGI